MSSDFKNLMRTQCEEVKLRDGFWLNMYEQYSTHTFNFMFDIFCMLHNIFVAIPNNNPRHNDKVKKPKYP